MANETMDNYMKVLAGYVYDDDKLVTYAWLSKEFEIHVNFAKQILWDFWQMHKDEGDIVATVMLIGHLVSGGMRVEVVRESDLSKAKEKFSAIISEHIYSLQKTLPDLELLAFAGEGDCRFSAIRCKESILQSEEKLRDLHLGEASSDETPGTSNEKTNLTNKLSESECCIVSTSNSNVLEKKAPALKKNIKTQKETFNQFFGKTGGQQKQKDASLSSSNPVVEKSNEVSPKISIPKAMTDSSSKKTKSTSSANNMQRNAFNSFFEKAISQEKSLKSTASKALIDNSKEKSETCSPIDKEKDISVVDTRSSPAAESQSPQEFQENNKNISNNKKQAKNTQSIKTKPYKKRQRSKGANDKTKKRKRIVIESDSSEESCRSEGEPEQLEQLEERPPLREKSPSPPRVKNVSGRRVVRKTVDKTFADEHGFFVTEKVHVYESCSDDEVIVEDKKPSKPQPEVETKSNIKKNTKQTKLTNFFTKS